MKTKFCLTFLCSWLCASVFAQAKRDTIFIYDTIRVTVKRPAPAPPSENFFEEKNATFSKDSIILDEEQIKHSSIMNNFKKSANKLIRNFAVGTAAAISSVTTLVAQDNVSKSQIPNEPVVTTDTVIKDVVLTDTNSQNPPLKFAPLNIGFAYPISIYGKQSNEYSFNFSAGFLTDVAGEINGLQWSMLYNQVNGSMNGIQWAGLLNITGEVAGIQWAGICNFSKNVTGIQWAGILNQSQDVKGIQWAGIANLADNVKGVQAAGIYNAADSVAGMQASGIANEAQYVQGGQWAGIFNRAKHVNGVQIGLINSTKTLSGVQIGLFNKVDTIHKGISIGVFNFLKKDRFQELELSANLRGSTYLTYRIGGSIFHGIIGIGTSWKDGNLDTRFGFGNSTRLKGSLYRQSAIYGNSSGYYQSDWDDNYHDNWMTVSCGLAYYWGDKIGLKITPSYNLWIEHTGHKWNENLSASYEFGLDFGLSIRL